MLHGASTSTPSAEATSLATTLATSRQSESHKAVLLATARVKVADRYGSPHEVRVLIDQCSEVTLDITSDVTNAELRVVAFVLPRISLQQGTAQREDRSWPHIQGLRLADPRFLDDDPAELLLGAEVYSLILEEGLRKGGSRMPIAQQTSLGWILSGGYDAAATDGHRRTFQCTADNDLADLVRRFWEEEHEPVAGILLTADEARCENIYVRTVTRTSSGRYVVRLPFASPPTSLSETRRPAERLLEAMERKGARDARFGDLYRDFMDECEDQQHMEKVSTSTTASSPRCYLPHHGVLKESSTTTKLRLKTVTYGLACAPFLAIRTLQQLTANEEARYPRGVRALRHDCYVDDVVTGADSLADAIELQQELRSLCMAGGFPLRKWAANDQQVLTGIPPEHRLQRGPHSWEGESHATLGLRWYPQGDWFSFTIRPRAITDLTKRRVLAETSRLFDPMGWLAPVVIRTKILIQTTWLQRLDWDSPLPDQDAHRWRQLLNQLPLLDHIRVDHWLNTGDDQSQLQLHGFADASEQGYAAVVYIRNAATEKTSINLLMAKSKVAPVKQVSLPRLELCAAALLTTIMLHVRATLGLTATPVHLWSDSKVTLQWIRGHCTIQWIRGHCTLQWIRGHCTRWKTFVANRVSQIQTLLPDAQWRHVAGRENLADCASRGVTPDDLLNHELWWTGPTWLSGDEAAWPGADIDVPEDDLPEQRATSLVVKVPVTAKPDLLLRFPTLQRLLRVTAWCRRWLNPVRRDATPGRPLHPDELDAALFRWLRVVQALHFPTDVAAASAPDALVYRKAT
ncbi:uncharacterized protein LOC114932247 [Nylanderia fulva]|uniref:uncharacterized protein LOC114932247 n=1 Tax=Nylanderia fulva TaxID=613905 RepID=UPI0010FB20A7|nr:uncharacterized protein LOC114932247 [Nylanderia fulva]